MWNIFKAKQNPQQERAGEEDPEQIARHLRVKFEQRMKLLSQNIKKSEELFSVYSQISPRQQEIASTFEEVIATLEGLVSIIEELNKEIGQTQQQLEELKRARHMVANHHNIVSNLQDSYSEQIRTIYQDHQKYLQSSKAEREELERRIYTLQQEKYELKQELIKFQEEGVGLQIERHQLRVENKSLQVQVKELSLNYHRFLEGSNEVKKVINFEVMKLEYLFYYGRLREGITQYLTVSQFQELKRASKFYKHSLQKQESKFLVRNLKSHYQRKQSQEAVNLKHYEKVLQLFPLQNIKMNAIKYLHFRIKPATYILPYLQQETEQNHQKSEAEPKQKERKFNWRGFFASQKQKKQESKFSLSQLKNQEEFKRVQSKVESTFKSILSIKLPEDLQYFNETMERQLSQLKENLGNKGSKGSQAAWTAQLHCLCRFMYLEVNQLYNLLQAIFGELVVKSRKLTFAQEERDELKENQTILRNLIENLSHDKAYLQKKAILIENEILKRNLEKDTILNNFQQIVVEATQNRQKYQNLLTEHANLRKTIEKTLQERRQFDENVALIRKQLQFLEGSPGRERKLSQGSMCSQSST